MRWGERPAGVAVARDDVRAAVFAYLLPCGTFSEHDMFAIYPKYMTGSRVFGDSSMTTAM
jgi:hypothetical protein